MQRLQVSFEYKVCFTRGVFSLRNPILEEVLSDTAGLRTPMLLCADEGLLKAQPGLSEAAGKYLAQKLKDRWCRPVMVLPGGEAAKNDPRLVERLIRRMKAEGLCRHSYIVAMGGGSVLDVVGFAVSIFHRGMRLVRLPTTAVAQADGGVGVKTAVNRFGGKNLIGTFAPPWAVINDPAFLRTLAPEDWRGGLAEAFKVAAIKDRQFWLFLQAHADELKARSQQVMEAVVRRSAECHLKHIQAAGDPFEFGSARPLDFGHWAAHEIEAMTGYRVGHGEAVGVGIALDAHIAWQGGWLAGDELQAFGAAMERAGLALWHEALARRDARGRLRILRGLERFREHMGGRLTLTLPGPMGRSREIHELPSATVEKAVLALKERRERRNSIRAAAI